MYERIGGPVETQTRGGRRISRRRFTVHDYHRMAEAGILHEDDRVELIEGEVVEMTPIGGRHASCVAELTWLLSRQIGDELRLCVQNPVRLGEHGEPQPDLAVIRARDYKGSLPGPEDVMLLIEVADTSLSYDREVKLPLYARAGIAEAWLVDLSEEVVDGEPGERRHWNPQRCPGSSFRWMPCSADLPASLSGSSNG
jgi:Uma2 family endonuclease